MTTRTPPPETAAKPKATVTAPAVVGATIKVASTPTTIQTAAKPKITTANPVVGHAQH